MSMPRNLGDRDRGPAPRTLASDCLLARRRPVLILVEWRRMRSREWIAVVTPGGERTGLPCPSGRAWTGCWRDE